MFAEVIVDIPAAQVNRPFTYEVPEDYQSSIDIGMRVEVPFGSRQLMGIVVKFLPKIDPALAGKIRPITRLLDYQSFLNEELIELSYDMTEELQTFHITVLSAMLPSMLKVKYETVFKLLDSAAYQSQLADWRLSSEIFETIPRESLEAKLSAGQIKQLLDAGIIEVEYRVLNQARKKYIETIQLAQPVDVLEEALAGLDGRSHKQRDLLSYLLEHAAELPLASKQVLEATAVSRSTLKTMAEKGWVELTQQEVYRDPLAEQTLHKTQARPLTEEQAAAYQAILPAIENHEPKTFLIEGVTGSGKTEIYLQLMERVRQLGQTAILLVPEIALTPQMVGRVTGRFEKGVAVLHSGLSVAEKYDEWRRIINGDATIVVGARSSIFAPLANIGLIIIDEEHETTYKQSDNPRYHALDVAKWRAKYHQAPLVLASATPSIESRARGEVGNYELLRLTQRVNQRPLPPIEIVDMTQVAVQETLNEFSPRLQAAIQERLAKQEQVVLMLNRRGYASSILCRECGHVMQCPRCDISLTYHKAEHQLKCHYCDYHQGVPSTCPNCQSHYLRTQGMGTQRIAETLQELFPEASVVRMDNDTTRRKGQHQKLLDTFGRGEADILLGTQMIAKGLDFEKVTLVGVINADTSLSIPDFRAGEKTFQLLTQVSGRAGRGEFPGEVIIQTYNPDHYVMQLVKDHNYEGFFYSEMQRRHLTNYPPYYYTSLITVKSKHQGKAMRRIYDIKTQLARPEWLANDQLHILGPSQGAIARINDHYYYQLLLKYKQKDAIHAGVQEVFAKIQEDAKQGVYISIDHNPLQFI